MTVWSGTRTITYPAHECSLEHINNPNLPGNISPVQYRTCAPPSLVIMFQYIHACVCLGSLRGTKTRKLARTRHIFASVWNQAAICQVWTLTHICRVRVRTCRWFKLCVGHSAYPRSTQAISNGSNSRDLWLLTTLHVAEKEEKRPTRYSN